MVEQVTQLIKFNTNIFTYHSYFNNSKSVAISKLAYKSVFLWCSFDPQLTFSCGFYRVFSKMISYNMFYFILRKIRKRIRQYLTKSR